MSAAVRRLPPGEYPRAIDFYRGHGDLAFIDPAATILVAEAGPSIVGIVRLAEEHGLLVLRGMHVATASRGRGLGRALLRCCVQQIADRACYCLPYIHLLRFYGQHGFVPEPEGAGPPHLLRRLEEYRQQGKTPMTLVRRPAP